MRQRRQAGVVERRKQEADGDPDRLADVVVLPLLAPLVTAPRLLENGDQVRRVGEVRLEPVGTERIDRLEELAGRALTVEELLLALGRGPDGSLDLRVRDDDEPPRLLVCAVAAVRTAFAISSNATGSDEKCRTERRRRMSARNSALRRAASASERRGKSSRWGT
jgi:hypothetical protein